ncbi:hypothetical protein IMSAGC007_03080 [Lachnospiraceae bacterium]|nr:hypothetical protein IMSAGC007_03080 [Lachnospiraceae bacterium]
MMNIQEFYYKGKAKIRYLIYNRNFGKKWFPFLYASYWHMRLQRRPPKERYENYFSARPNPGAGIGHQMANWIAGYWYAKQFGLRFAHIPFSNSRIPYTKSSWESFLGFGEGEVSLEELVKEKGCRIVRLPMFGGEIEADLTMIRRIIRSYTNKRVVFLAEQDQFYREQYGVRSMIQDKFFHAPVQRGKLLYDQKKGISIAVHIRRGDVTAVSDNPNITMRWLDVGYYQRVLTALLKALKGLEAQIYIFSQGKKEEFEPYFPFPNVHYCVDMAAEETFWHLVKADILLISKSSFSYKPALLSKGIIVAPEHFWHGYPDSEKWIVVNEEGEVNERLFDISLKLLEKGTE